MKQSFFIDMHKGATALFVLALIAWFDRWQSPTAWIYLALHGTYGLLWVWKSRVFPDSQWDQRCSIWYGLLIWAGLSLYWIAPWLVVSSDVEAPAWLLGIAVSLWGAGVFLHFVSDMQKHASMAWRRGTLLDDGLWAHTRNPNYLGELMIYGAFALLPLHWAPPLILLAWFVLVWAPNMAKKDRSLSRYPAFASWRERSGLIFPSFLR